MGYSPWGHKGSDTTDHACTSCIKTSSGFPLLLHYGVLYNHFLIYHNAIIIEIKCIVTMLKPGLPPHTNYGEIIIHKTGTPGA